MSKKLKLLTATAVLILGMFLLMGEKSKAATDYPYLIKVNRQQCVVTIYEKDKKGEYTVPIKAMLCSPGWDTPLGSFKTPAKYRWRLLMGDVWGQYSTRINKGVLFHSVWYYEQDPSTLSNVQYNKLGTVCSHGCVRLTVEDAKWIYDNCPVGTTVTIYDSKDPGPLGKPEAIKVSTANKMGYDPTDIWSSGNPYIKKSPTITGVSNKKISYGKKVDINKGVKATSSTGQDITKNIKVTIVLKGKKVKKVDTTVPGKYIVTYSIVDKPAKEVKKEATFTIVDDVKPILIGAKNIYLNGEEEVNASIALDEISATWHDKPLEKSDISVKLTKKENAETYEIYDARYEVTAPNGKKAVKTKQIYMDLEAPIYKGITDKEISEDMVVDRAFALEGVTIKDNLTKVTLDDIKVTITKENDTQYKVTYWVKDKSRNIARASAIYTIIAAPEDTVPVSDSVVTP